MAVKASDIPFSSASTPEIKQRIFRDRGEQRYSLELLPAGVEFFVDRLRRERHELTGELIVSLQQPLPGARTVDGVLSAGDFNFSSVQARSTRAKLLAERANIAGVDWYGFLEEFCLKTIQAERSGKPAVVLADIPLSADDDPDEGQWLVDGFPVLKELPMVLFGDSGSGKSYFVLWLAGKLAQMGVNVLYADWEFSEREHRKRLQRLFQPMPKGIFYVRCDTPLAHQADRLHKVIREHACQFLICDSIGFAGDGPAESQETAAKYFKALRQLRVGSLNIAHIPKQSDDGREASIFGCYSADTDVLTLSGWKPHAEVTLADEVLCFDPATSGTIWAQPSVVHAYDYAGDLLHLETSTTDALVTPNHRCLIRDPEHDRAAIRSGVRYKPTWRFCRADDLPRLSQAPLGTPPSTPRADYPVDGGDDFLRLLGWWIAEGSFHSKQRSFQLAQAEGPLATEMCATLDRLGLPYTRTRSVNRKRPHELPMIYLTSRQTPQTTALTDWLRAHAGVGAQGKKLPSLAWHLSPRQQAVLLSALVDGDGTRYPYGGMLYHTISKQLADDVQRLALEIGHPASLRWDPPGKPHHAWRATVKIGRAGRQGISLYPKRHVSRVPYEGKVYCLTVPTGAYVTRRNGKMAIYGNSTFWRAGARSAWFCDKASTNPPGELRFGLHHRKTNVGELLRPKGYKLVWDRHRTRLESIDLKTVEELTVALPLLDRIKRILSHGPMTPKALAEELNVAPGNVRAALSRHKSTFVKLGPKVALLEAGDYEAAPAAPAPAGGELF